MNVVLTPAPPDHNKGNQDQTRRIIRDKLTELNRRLLALNG